SRGGHGLGVRDGDRADRDAQVRHRRPPAVLRQRPALPEAVRVKIPYTWIREFVDLRLSAAEAADRLMNAGIEVAAVTPLAPDVRGVVIGEIEAIERELGDSHGHRLLLCRVSTGRQKFSVICGAPNTKVGVRAAFAPPGAVLPGDRRIGATTIRGVESQGMLCSERELGFGLEHEAGIFVLDGDAPLGADLIAHLGLDDHVLDVEPTPNRPDCLSVLGVARELAALTGTRLRVPTIAPKEAGAPVRTLVRVRIGAPDLCHRFTARVVSGVTVGPSPAWLQARLRAVGLRPISDVADVTNYVRWELGNPTPPSHYAAGPARARPVRPGVDPSHLAGARPQDRRRVPLRARRRHRGARGRVRARGSAHRGARRRRRRPRYGGRLSAAPPATTHQAQDGARETRARRAPAAVEGQGDSRRPRAPDPAEGEGPRDRGAELQARPRDGG